jgi:hypothetical protein
METTTGATRVATSVMKALNLRSAWAGLAITLFAAAILIAAVPGIATDDETCLDCHDDTEFTKERDGKEISLHVEYSIFKASAHSGLECVDCHEDASDDHPEDLNRVYCGDCHDDVQLDFDASIHGRAYKRDVEHAPSCSSCHGIHDIALTSDPTSPTYKMNIPVLCGTCHREGAPVASTYEISEHNIIENYSQGIHGEGLFKKGLTVTATCNDCHGSHRVLPHSEPAATISPRNIAAQ